MGLMVCASVVVVVVVVVVVACEGSGGRFDESFPASAFFFFLKWRSVFCALIQFVRSRSAYSDGRLRTEWS